MSEALDQGVVKQGPSTMLAVIERVAANPDVDPAKMMALLELQERMMTRQAEINFNQALARLPAMRVKKNGRVSLGQGKGSYPFARWEDIDTIIRPLLSEEGFTLGFTSADRQGDGGGLVVTGTLRHRDGHSICASMGLPLDTGPGRNNLQAKGSSLSYGKRYCAEMLLNIVREGDDNDGAGADEMIGDEECQKLSVALTETKSDLTAFLQWMGVAAIPEIRQRDLTRAWNMLNQKKARQK